MGKQIVYNLNGKSPDEVKKLYDQFLANSALSGLTSSNISNYKNAFKREEIRMALKKACGTNNLYSIVDVGVLEKALIELANFRLKYKNDKTKLKRIKDSGSYLKKYIKFLELCEVEKTTLGLVPNEKGLGYCYIITNPAFQKNYIKIGYTDSLERRLNDLYNTSIPLRFEVYAALRTVKYKEAEELMHKAFDEQRISSDREFFLMLRESALDYLKVIAKGLGGELLIYGKDGKPKNSILY